MKRFVITVSDCQYRRIQRAADKLGVDFRDFAALSTRLAADNVLSREPASGLTECRIEGKQ